MTAFFAVVGAVTLSSVLTAAEPAALTCKVVSIDDGDTLRVLDHTTASCERGYMDDTGPGRR